MPTIECPHCRVAMVEGYCLDRQRPTWKAASVWIEGKPETSWNGFPKLKDRMVFEIAVYRCPQCGYLASYATQPETHP